MKKTYEFSISGGTGFGLCTGLTTIFIVLKLVNAIKWSWVWVFSPMWIWLIVVILALAVVGFIYNLINAKQ